MNSVNATLRDRILLRTHYLSRFETSQRQALLETLQQAHDSIIAKIATTGGKDTKAWLEQVLLDVDGIYAEAFKAMGGELNASMKALSKLEAEWAAANLDKTIPLNVSVTTPSPAQVWAAVTTSPADRGHLLSELMDAMERGTVERIRGAIRQGVVEGETIDDMVRRIRGTVVRAEGYVDVETGKRIVGKTTAQMKAMAEKGTARKVPGAYQGGAMDTSTRSAEALARTAVMHVSNVARGKVNQENADLLDGEQWVATLDTRTCAECGPEDGKVYPVGEGPVPPLHINCRCVRIPVVKSWKDLGFDLEDVPPGSRASMDGQVPDSLTYGEWLKTQSAEVQNDALGPARAELFRGGMSVNRFVQDGRVLRLDEL